jgi:glycosyltransferase involved in cell wall biosynthesis
VGGYKLERKLSGVSFAHPIIAGSQSPLAFLSSARRLRRLIAERGFDIVHCHLTHDHWLTVLAVQGVSKRPLLARTFHSRRTLRTGPLTELLLLATQLVFTINAEFHDAPLLAGRAPVFTPPPLDERIFAPEGRNARTRYGIAPAEKVVTAIGKIAPGRGFEDVLRTFALIRRELGGARLLIIGEGPHRSALEALSRELAIEPAVTWAGYHEDDLPEHYRAADLLLFTARGSDEGHRAVLEAMGCGTPVAAYPLEGLAALAGPLASRVIATVPSPESLALCAIELLDSREEGLRADCVRATASFRLAQSAERLIRNYEHFLGRRPAGTLT